MVDEVLKKFAIDKDHIINTFGNGLINNTWIVSKNGTDDKFILQRINHHIFKSPRDISFNIRLITDYLPKNSPSYLFPAPILTADGSDLVETDAGYFRMFPFVKNSHTIDVVKKPEQAYEAARQFAKFTSMLSGIDVSLVRITLPDFHNLHLRYAQFEMALKEGKAARVNESKQIIDFLHHHKAILDEFEQIKLNPEFKVRVMHHDTKISNVLFDEDDKGLCVIDLDTVMPGYFISDIGDMMRTYLSPVSEEEKDFTKIEIRKEFFDAIVVGYIEEMGGELSNTERKYFIYAGKFMIYMQALRFLTDYINNDIYYGSKYDGHNFLRAGNQVVLLKKLLQFEQDNKV